MFTAVSHKHLAEAESYFDEHLAQNDYYAAGEIRPGQWIGAGAERLGLSNAVTREQFHALCENLNPQNDERLTQRQLKADSRDDIAESTWPPKRIATSMPLPIRSPASAGGINSRLRLGYRAANSAILGPNMVWAMIWLTLARSFPRTVFEAPPTTLAASTIASRCGAASV